MTQPLHVAHLSSVHHVSDTRVFHKECKSIAEAGFHVTLIINTDRLGAYVNDGVNIRSLKRRRGGRLSRLLWTSLEVFKQAKRVNADIYHFHDPELMAVGTLLRMSGKRVIYDAHEHVAKQILTKNWVPKLVRRPLSTAYRAFEKLCAYFILDAVVVADPSQTPLYPRQKVVVVENFPIISEYATKNEIPYAQRCPIVSYVGGLSNHRGVKEMVAAVELINQDRPCRLALAGKFMPKELSLELTQQSGWQFVDYKGFLKRPDVYQLLSESKIGIVVLHPIPNYVTSQPVKLLEYMAVGLPVIVSDFPYYRQYVENNNCGIMVNPLRPQELADAIQWLLDHPENAEIMGKRGRNAVHEKYNWHGEAQKLIDLYRTLLEKNAA